MKTTLIAGNSPRDNQQPSTVHSEGSTTRSQDRRSKWIEMGGILIQDGDIVSSAW
jgi:hypothetical protein